MICSSCDAEVSFIYACEAEFADLSETHLVEVAHQPENTGPLCLTCLMENLKNMVTQAESVEETDAI